MEKPPSRLIGRSQPEDQKSRLIGKNLESQGDRESVEGFPLKIGQSIRVRDLKVTTVTGFEVYTGQLTVKDSTEKGTRSALRGKSGVGELITEDRYYTFTQGDTVMICTAPEAAVKACIEKE